MFLSSDSVVAVVNAVIFIYTVSQKKEATLIFDITSPFVEIYFFTIFGAFCSGISSACYSIAHINFIYVVVGWTKTASYKICTRAAVVRHKTQESSIQLSEVLLFNRRTKGLHVNSTPMLFKISPLSFHTCVAHSETVSPLFDSCSAMSVVQLCPHLNYPMLQRVDICYVCLVHFLLHDTAERIVNKLKVWWVQTSRPQVRYYGIQCQCALCATASLTSCVTSRQIKASHK